MRLLSIEMPIGLAVGATLASFVLPAASTGALQLELLPALPTLELAKDITC